MNKSKHFLFFLGMASLTFTGCSTSDNFAEAAADDIPQLTEDEKWVLEANSDVEIKLGTGGNQAFTRAFVEGDESNLFETKEGIGMFCLAASKMDTSAPNIDWTAHASSNEGRYMNWMGSGTSTDGSINTVTWGGNVKANAKKMDGVTRIAWEDNFTRFYPMGNWYNYTFYGYHPYQNNVTTTASTVSVDIPIDGYTDVLWGRSYRPVTEGSDPVYNAYAYSGRYFREYFKKNSKDAETPVMKFKHALSRINFKVVKGDNRPGKLYVKEVKLMGDVSNKVTLKVADANTANNNTGTDASAGTVKETSGAGKLTTDIANGIGNDGKLSYDKAQPGVALPYDVTWDGSKNVVTPLFNEDRENGVELTHSKEGDNLVYTQLGKGIMVPPTSSPDYKLQLTIVLEKDGKTYTFVPQFPQSIKFPDAGLEQGKQYNVYLTIYTPQEIVVNAVLVPWEEVDMTDGNGGIEF